MKRLFLNVLTFFVAIILFIIITPIAIFYNIFNSLLYRKTHSFLKYWSDFFYTVNVGIDQIGNVIVAEFMNNFAIKSKDIYLFGQIDDTISYCLAKNLGNLTRFGQFIVNVLEKIHPGHMNYVLSEE